MHLCLQREDLCHDGAFCLVRLEAVVREPRGSRSGSKGSSVEMECMSGHLIVVYSSRWCRGTGGGEVEVRAMLRVDWSPNPRINES